MKKVLLLFSIVACIAVFYCCPDNLNEDTAESATARDYATDSKVLAKYVDIDENAGTYFINDNKKLSVMDYVCNTSSEELQRVSPVNRSLFQKEIDELNARLEDDVRNHRTSLIVYSTYDKVWVRHIQDNTSLGIEACKESNNTRSSNSTLGTLNVYGGGKSKCSFTGPKTIYCRIKLNPSVTSYYYFDILCKTDAKKDPNPNNNERLITLSGVSMLNYDYFKWTAYAWSSSINWNFESRGYNPTNITNIATVDFTK